MFPQDKSGYFFNGKIYGENGTGEKCSIIIMNGFSVPNKEVSKYSMSVVTLY